jgi:signal transduction histidine kinase
MKQMWVRLSLAFSAVVFISFALVAVLTVTIVRANAQNSFEQERERIVEGLTTQLQTYYTSGGNWDGVASLFSGAQAAFPYRMFNDGVRLVDAYGNTIAGDLPTDAQVGESTPITADGVTIGTLEIAAPPSPENKPIGGGFWIFRDMVRLDELLVLLMFVGGTLSLLFGIMISRWLTTSLDELAEATRAIGEGKLDRRVEEAGTEEVKTLAKSFNRMVDQLHDAEQLRRNLVADVAHELRTPITALQANLYAILDDAYPMTKTEIAGLYEQTRTLSRLVTDLHEIAQAEARQLPLNCKPTDLGGIIEEIAAPFSVVAESKEIAFEVAIAPALPTVLADKHRITQVINNLLSNALRHTPEGGTITLAVDKSASDLQITISDTGEGIAPEHLPHLFDRFYRVDSGRSRDMGGTGLGLAIVKAIISAHGGQVSVSSDLGKGTCMLVSLPVGAA